MLELGCSFAARHPFEIEDRASPLVAVDFNLSDAIKDHPKFFAIESNIDSKLPEIANYRLRFDSIYFNLGAS
jgi:hypothetical protein